MSDTKDHTVNFSIKNRWDGAVSYTCELTAEIAAMEYRFQLGFAVMSAAKENANLGGADLGDASLGGASLGGADLRYADLSGADLRGADLRSFRADFIAEVLKLPAELDNLRGAIIAGRIDGSTYSGECACLAGTLAKAHFGNDVAYDGNDIDLGVITFVADSGSPREQWFMLIGVGDTPETNQASKIALEWLDEAIAMRDNIRRMVDLCARK
jgi:uncharacterized protein YjbI with pentapeptide repeats